MIATLIAAVSLPVVGGAAAALAGAFVAGVLVGRRNPKKVEATVEEAKAILAKAGIKV